MSISRQQREFYRLFSQHGSGDALVRIKANDVALLTHIAAMDLHSDTLEWMSPQYIEIAKKDFFEITFQDIESLDMMSEEQAVDFLQLSGASNPANIIFLYLRNLCELYRRRFKFVNVLKKQPFPLVEQIGPKALIEYGNCENSLLFTWMCWRKWIYDIDNRSAQETGYLFEPILASCLGGVSVSHRHSPVKRINDSGIQTSEGRQIDCLIEETSEAYELKLRVTIAASGQGRFGEEMSFPVEAERAGLKPVLVVFDPTPSTRLDDLKNQFVKHGGRFAIGGDAWGELITRAGNEMGIFIQKYIEPPIKRMGEQVDIMPAALTIEAHNDLITIRDAKGNEYKINRFIVDE